MNKIDLHGRVAVITGGARGIGYAIAERMMISGAIIMLWDIDSAQLQKAEQQLSVSGKVSVYALELTDEKSVLEAAADVVKQFGKIDILVNNAGITGNNGFTWEIDPDVWRRVIEVNLIAPYLTCRTIVPYMIANGYGRIINVASIAGKEGNPRASHYSASKAGLICLTKSLGKELATKNVLVNCITPAAAKTEILEQLEQSHIDYMLSKIPMNRFLKVEEAAALVSWLASEDCSFTTGAIFDISGGRAVY
ncbi:MAG: SDR family NAD(P)-dependent oxidoreductase [Chitinophagaceae bacterium]